MPLVGFDDLYRFADNLPSAVSVVAAGGADPTVLQALSLAQRRGWVEPVLTGSGNQIRQLASDLQIDLVGFRIIDAEDAAAAAVAEVKAGRAQTLMKGQIATPALMTAVLSRETGLRTGRCICQVVLMEIPRDRRRSLLSDTGITVQPTLDQKADILQSLVEVSTVLAESGSSERPRVAVMSATEKVAEAMPDTLEAAELTRQNASGDFSGCIVQGPLSFDLAYAADAGEKKKIEGGVVGAADAMLFPDLLSANLTVKAIMYTADCRFGGVLCGTTSPVVFMSRADTTTTRLNSLALTLRLLARS
jgi:phosphotransacetylase